MWDGVEEVVFVCVIGEGFGGGGVVKGAVRGGVGGEGGAAKGEEMNDDGCGGEGSEC